MHWRKEKALLNRLRKHHGIKAVVRGRPELDAMQIEAETPGLVGIVNPTVSVYLAGIELMQGNRRDLAALAANRIMRAIRGA